MVTVKAGSHVHRLLQLFAIAGEFPAASLGLLGNERTIKALVHRLESAQELRFKAGGEVYRTKVFQVSGPRPRRTVRLCKEALPLLSELHPRALEYYLSAFYNHQFPGSSDHIRRNHRVGEAIAMAMMAGLEMRPYMLPKLQSTEILRTVPDAPCYYIARDFKENELYGMNKTVFTRVVGAAFYPGGCYAVYNTREAVMKWAGMGEYKMMEHLSELARRNAGMPEVSSALLLGANPMVALQTILESSKRRELRMDAIYQSVHFVPLSAEGIRLLKILVLPDWKEKILSALFPPELRPRGYGSMEYDAIADGVFVFSHLDSDLARLVRFREGFRIQTKERFEVLCFPWQAGYLQAYLEDRAQLRIIEMEALEDEIF